MNSGRSKRYNRYENNNFENPDEEIYYDKPNKIPFNPKNMKSVKNAKKIPNQIKKKRNKSKSKNRLNHLKGKLIVLLKIPNLLKIK